MSPGPGAGLSWGQLLGAARNATGLAGFLRQPFAALPGETTASAARAVAARVERRAETFLATLDQLVFRVERSPLRRLLQWAGCEAGDLRRMVTADGIEATLTRLRAAGVGFTADEFRGRAPLCRSGLEMVLAPGDFQNPRLGGGVTGATSGSTGSRVAVRYSWAFLGSEAANEQLLLAAHGMDDAPLAFWMPGLPGIAGLHNLLVHAKLGAPPRRWFSPSAAPPPAERLAFCADRAWGAARRLLPRLGPAPEWVPPEQAAVVAGWLAASPRPAVLKCFASSALRVATAAAAAGLDLSRHVVFAGGEPLSEARRAFVARAGLRVYARYAATEAGFIAGACPLGQDGGDMHIHADRVALVAGDSPLAPGSPLSPGSPLPAGGALAITSLTAAAPLLLFNVELGDHGILRHQACDCALGRAGLIWRVNEVHSPEKVTAEGVKLGEVDFLAVLDLAVRALGGGPDDFQLQLGESAAGVSRLTIVLAPHSAVAAAALLRQLRERLPALPGGALAARLWLDGGALTVERRPLLLGPGHKSRRVVRP